ncbi:hypothetical protein CEUSTIGMA_g1961.t1 [Chlamydomonas eustigma]|uniref:Uncharacterized protein n=1 Tax=Chlamydomonas eustigma TaxID=1157962 RepID=A0A250WV70_9CHLO|nr:hypothetical protein CEUSTIGMA_g1961.t1 [Chlamydomonas eustigma]|eukprot:GAX74512.1 hypothetical protein CEUSTIGMA_g1961.t1 [Chlamydomonas eustigma]
MDSVRDISSRLRSLNGLEGNMSSALSLAQALLHHDPSAVALLPINPYNEDHKPILLLPSSVHIHYLKALLDWCVSQLVREPKPQKQNVNLSQSPSKMKITAETLPAASTPAYAEPGALKGSPALNSRMNPESWDLLSALLTGAWAGEAAAAAVPPSILSAAASALKHVSVGTRPITSSKASGPPLEHSLLTQDQLLHAAVNQCLHILFKIPALINPVSEHSSLVPSQNSHAFAVKQEAAAPASYLTNNPRFRPGLEPCIAFAAAVLDACPPKSHELALYTTSVAGLSSSNGNSSHIQWLYWLDSVYISVQAVHSSVQGHPNTKRVFQAVTSRLMLHLSAFIQPPMSHMTSQTLTTLPRDKAHDSSSLSGARYLGTIPATYHNSHLNTEIIEGLGGGSDTHTKKNRDGTKLKLKYNDTVVAEAELGKAILELLELTVFSDVHVTGLAEACLLTSSKALKLQASGGVDASVAELEEKQGRQDDSKTGVFDVGPNTSKVQTVELKDKKMKKKKKVKLEVPEADGADKDEEDASIAHQASVSAEKSQQEAVMPHQYILIQVVSEALECLSSQKNSNLDTAAAFQGNPLEQLNRQKMLLKQQQAAAGTLCMLPWMLTTFCKAAGRHRKIAASDALAAARACGRSHYHQSNVRGRQTNEGGPSTQHGPKNQGSQQGVASNSSKDLLPGAEFNMLQCLLGILLPLINIKIQDLVDSSVHVHEGNVRSNGFQDPLKRRNVEHSLAAQKPQDLRKRKRSENMKQQQKQGGRPGCAGILLQQEVKGDEDAEELSSHKDVVTSHRVVDGLAVTTTAKMAMSGLGSLLAAVKVCGSCY